MLCLILHQHFSKSWQLDNFLGTYIGTVKNTMKEHEKVIKSWSLSPKASGDLVLPPVCCVTWAKWCSLSEPQLNKKILPLKVIVRTKWADPRGTTCPKVSWLISWLLKPHHVHTSVRTVLPICRWEKKYWEMKPHWPWLKSEAELGRESSLPAQAASRVPPVQRKPLPLLVTQGNWAWTPPPSLPGSFSTTSGIQHESLRDELLSNPRSMLHPEICPWRSGTDRVQPLLGHSFL